MNVYPDLDLWWPDVGLNEGGHGRVQEAGDVSDGPLQGGNVTAVPI